MQIEFNLSGTPRHCYQVCHLYLTYSDSSGVVCIDSWQFREIVIFRKYVADVFCNTWFGSISATSTRLGGWGTSIYKVRLFGKKLFGIQHSIPKES